MWFAKSSFLSNTDTPLAKKNCHLMFQLRSDLFPETVPDVPIHLHFRKPPFPERATLTRRYPTKSLLCNVLKEARLLMLPPFSAQETPTGKAPRRGEPACGSCVGEPGHICFQSAEAREDRPPPGPVRTPAPAASHCPREERPDCWVTPSFHTVLCVNTLRGRPSPADGSAHPALHDRRRARIHSARGAGKPALAGAGRGCKWGVGPAGSPSAGKGPF